MNLGSRLLYVYPQAPDFAGWNSSSGKPGSDYFVGDDLEVLHELLEGGFSEDDIDFGRKSNSVIGEGEIEEKGMFNFEICSKECASSHG